MTEVCKLLFDLSLWFTLSGFYLRLAAGVGPSLWGFLALSAAVCLDALVRRLGSDEEESASNELVSGPFVLNPRNRTLEKDGQRLKLTQIEYLLMKLFMENPGKAMSREDILSAVWGGDFTGELKTVDVNIRRLRIKIESDPTEPEYLTTVWGYGYKWGF